MPTGAVIAVILLLALFIFAMIYGDRRRKAAESANAAPRNSAEQLARTQAQDRERLDAFLREPVHQTVAAILARHPGTDDDKGFDVLQAVELHYGYLYSDGPRADFIRTRHEALARGDHATAFSPLPQLPPFPPEIEAELFGGAQTPAPAPAPRPAEDRSIPPRPAPGVTDSPAPGTDRDGYSEF